LRVALVHITHQGHLAKVAQCASWSDDLGGTEAVRKNAVGRLTDQAMLKDLAAADIRGSAVFTRSGNSNPRG
jgi:hypothetical protein